MKSEDLIENEYTELVASEINRTKALLNSIDRKIYLESIESKLIEAIPYPIYYKNIDGQFIYCNSAFEHFFGVVEDDILGHDVTYLFDEKVVGFYEEADRSMMERLEIQSFHTKMVDKKGKSYKVVLSRAPIFDEQDRFSGIVGTIMDLTSLFDTEAQLVKMSNIKNAMLEINQAVMESDDMDTLFDLIVKKVAVSMDNADFCCIMALDRYEMLNIVASVGYDEKLAQNYRIRLRDSFVFKESFGAIESTVIINDIDQKTQSHSPSMLRNTKEINVQSCISAPIWIDGQLYGLINVDSKHNDIFTNDDVEVMEYMRNQIQIALTNHKMYKEIQRLSQCDELTGLYNRRYLSEMVENLIGEEQNFYLVVFDINGLKKVNDTYGHLTGDNLIIFFADELYSHLGKDSLLARIGGDEFVGVFDNCTGEQLMDRLALLKANFSSRGEKVFNTVCGFSFGVSSFPNDGQTYLELLMKADMAMYQHKKGKEKKETI